MVRKIFSVFDEKAGAYLQPFFFDTKGQAIRAITDCVNDPNHGFYRHASDYTLFELGEFDDTHGTFNPLNSPIGNLIEFKNVEVSK